MDLWVKTVHTFIEYLRSMRGASEHTVRGYLTDLQLFGSFAFRQNKVCTTLSVVDRALIREFIVSERGRGVSKRSLARRLSSLRSFFRYCLREKLIEQTPMEAIDTPKLDRPIPHSISYEQVERFFALPNTATFIGFRDRTMMELLYSSGLRISELAGMNRSDVDKDELLIRIRGKGKKERIIPVTENAAHWLEGYLAHTDRSAIEVDHEAVFLNRFGTRLTTRSIDRLFAAYLMKGGFADTITPHVIRHTIATHWLEQGMDLKTIQLLLGHASMATTTIYTEVSSELKKRVIAALHPRA